MIECGLPIYRGKVRQNFGFDSISTARAAATSPQNALRLLGGQRDRVGGPGECAAADAGHRGPPLPCGSGRSSTETRSAAPAASGPKKASTTAGEHGTASSSTEPSARCAVQRTVLSRRSPRSARVSGSSCTRKNSYRERANVAASSGGGAAATARSSRSRAAVASTSGHLSRNWDFFAGGLLASPRVRFFGLVRAGVLVTHYQALI